MKNGWYQDGEGCIHYCIDGKDPVGFKEIEASNGDLIDEEIEVIAEADTYGVIEKADCKITNNEFSVETKMSDKIINEQIKDSYSDTEEYTTEDAKDDFDEKDKEP